MDQFTNVPEPYTAPQTSQKSCKWIIGGMVGVVTAALVLSGCSPSKPEPATSSPASTAAASSQAAASTATAAALSQCSGSDNGIKYGFEAWETAMKSDDSFTAWVKDTADIQSTASDAQSTDLTFGETDGASAAGTLAMALRVVESDLQQGEQTGEAPSSYKTDIQAAIADEAPFEACSAAS